MIVLSCDVRTGSCVRGVPRRPCADAGGTRLVRPVFLDDDNFRLQFTGRRVPNGRSERSPKAINE